MKTNPVSRRLASRLHIAQIETLRRAEGITRAIDRTANEAAKKIMAAVGEASQTFDIYRVRTIERAIEPLWREIAETMLKQFRAIAGYANNQAVNTLIDTVPRKWWRVVVPTLPVKEAVVPFPFSGQQPPIPPFPPRVLPTPGEPDFGPLQIDIEHEPVLKGGLSDAEFKALLKEIIFPPPSAAKVNEWVFQGDWAARLGNLSQRVTNPQALATEIAFGISSGENLQELTKRVRSITDVAASSAKRIARTEGMRISGIVQNESFAGLGDLEIGLQHHAQIDQNSRPDHAALNGHIYYHEPGPGQDGIDQMVIEPGQDRLPNCRCWSSPVLREPDEVRDDSAIRAEFENAEGDEIPDPGAYDRWFAQADEGTRKEAVGIGRYNAAKGTLGREPDWIDMIDPQGNLMSKGAIANEAPDVRFQRRAEVFAMLRRREDLLRQVSSKGFVFSR